MTVVQALWVEGPLSDLERLSLRSFVANGHEVHLFSYGEPAGVPPGVRILPAAEVLPPSAIFRYREGGSVAGFSNLFRYKLLHDRGGWWCDTDVVCLRPLPVPEDWVFASERKRRGGTTLATAVVWAPAGSELMAACLSAAANHPDRDARWGITGPAMLGAAVEQHGLAAHIRPPEVFCPIDWFAAEDLFRATELPAEALTVHLWNEIWNRNGWQREARYAPEALYQRLHRRYPA